MFKEHVKEIVKNKRSLSNIEKLILVLGVNEMLEKLTQENKNLKIILQICHPFLVGDSGTGKTGSVMDLIESFKLSYVNVNLSAMQKEDVTGIPIGIAEKKKVIYSQPTWNDEQYQIAFFDEIDESRAKRNLDALLPFLASKIVRDRPLKVLPIFAGQPSFLNEILDGRDSSLLAFLTRTVPIVTNEEEEETQNDILREIDRKFKEKELKKILKGSQEKLSGEDIKRILSNIYQTYLLGTARVQQYLVWFMLTLKGIGATDEEFLKIRKELFFYAPFLDELIEKKIDKENDIREERLEENNLAI